MSGFPRVASFKTLQAFREHLQRLGVQIPTVDQLPDGSSAALAQPWSFQGVRVGNRWCIQPMEGWDGTPEGLPSELTLRRWSRFGKSGAKLIWGGEAVAVRHDGRANPNQLRIGRDTLGGFVKLRETLEAAHRESGLSTDDLLIGLQLTHSGRFCRPNRKDRLEPKIAYHHPLLDRRFGIDPDDDTPILSDAEVEDLIADFVAAARLAREAGFRFVDIKHCHGYLLHEFLSARDRPGPYGGDFEGRTRLAAEIIKGIRRECPDLLIGVRLSVFDFVPFRPDPAASKPGKLGRGIPEDLQGLLPYRWGFGTHPERPWEYDLSEPIRFLEKLVALGVFMVNLTCGSPYYVPHIMRPALFPPSDGYGPPEDPLVGVARQINVVRQIKERFPHLPVVGTGYSYLQEFLPHVAEAVVREGWTDFVGLGRMILSYPELPRDVLAGRPLDRRRICRTFSDCTTGPRNGMVSGCFPLDPFYRNRPEYEELQRIKQALGGLS